jgi:polar amino acid transport system substrate-binding protein
MGFALSVLVTGIPLAAQAEATYTAGVEASYAPWAYVDHGEYKGIAIDAMRAIAKAEGFKVKFKDLPFPSLIPALSTGKIDILVTGLTVTEKRSKVIDFTIPWWETNDVILVPKKSTLNIFTAVCCGAKIGVQGGSSQQAWMDQNVVKPGKVDVTLATYDSYETAVSDMLAGRLAAVDLDDTTAQTWIAKGRPIKSVGEIFIRAPMALAVKKHDSRPVLAQLNKGIMAIAKSGEWQKIVHQYLPGVTIPPIPSTMPAYVDTYAKPVAGLPNLGN